jgi:hypothetical protein
MKPSQHLTDIQIAAFSACTLPEGESREVGRHLLGCVNCRGLLPLPDPNSFWTAIMSEGGYDRSRATSTDSPFRQFVGLFSKPGTLAWSAGTLVVILSLTLLILFTDSKESGVESDVAKTFESENPISGPEQTKEPRIMLPLRPESAESQSKPTPSGLSVAPQFPDRNHSRSTERSNSLSSKRAGARLVDANISSTRGMRSKCRIERTFEMQLGSAESDLVLKWARVPNATKYHVYISDDNEILIDEFETEKDTSYTLKKTLDPHKAYKWKIIITLENGQTLSVDAQKFSARDFQSSQKVRRSKAKSDTRCLASQ